MKVLAVCVVLGGCVGEGEPEESTLAAAAVSPSGQGVDYQGVDYQGVDYQGVDYQGTAYDGASYGGASFLYGTVDGSQLVGWQPTGTLRNRTWEQRFPDHICYWNSTRTILDHCTYVDLATAPSPIAGSRWPATFMDAYGKPLNVTLQIGASARDLGAVGSDRYTGAMHPISGGSTCGMDHRASCTNPAGCRLNCDVWLYDVYVEDTNGRTPLCPADQRALAVAGTYDRTGQRTTGNGQFTFACTNGTIAKCTRWGYRPFGGARKCTLASCDTSDPVEPLAKYHQACVRAATADYCANGHSFTRNGTLVDIWDYVPYPASAKGFVPRTQILEWLAGRDATALLGESHFDMHGATSVEYMRYFDLGTLEQADACPGKFSFPTLGEDGHQLKAAERLDPPREGPVVGIDSTPICSHSEYVAGKPLHEECSRCTLQVWGATDQHCSRTAWDDSCVAAATACPAADRMTTHSECRTGPALRMYDSGCTLRVCQANAACCTTGWTSACVAAANATCEGGFEHSPTSTGFCPLVNAP